MKYTSSSELVSILLANGLKEQPKPKEIELEGCQPGYHPEGHYKRVFKYRESDNVSLILNYSIMRIEHGVSYIEVNPTSEGQLIALLTLLKSDPCDQVELIKAIKKGGLHTMLVETERLSKSNQLAYSRFKAVYSSVIL